MEAVTVAAVQVHLEVQVLAAVLEVMLELVVMALSL
jgi:hypothetical protein